MTLIEQFVTVLGSVWLGAFMMGVAVVAIVVAITAMLNPSDGGK